MIPISLVSLKDLWAPIETLWVPNNCPLSAFDTCFGASSWPSECLFDPLSFSGSSKRLSGTSELLLSPRSDCWGPRQKLAKGP